MSQVTSLAKAFNLALRKCAFTFEKTVSMGLNSGLAAMLRMGVMPYLAYSSRTVYVLWQLSLSMNR